MDMKLQITSQRHERKFISVLREHSILSQSGINDNTEPLNLSGNN